MMSEAMWTAIAISLSFIGIAISALVFILGLTLIKRKWPDLWK